jgi:C4-type Zn-finger protein
MPNIFGVMDECPACHKSCKVMSDEHSGKFIHIAASFVVCSRCGCVFLPQSRIKHVFAEADKKIIDPASPEAKQTLSPIISP